MEKYVKRKSNCEEVADSSSDTEDDFFKPSTIKRKYTQKLRKSWFQDNRLSDWIMEVNDNQVKCKYCDCTLMPKLSILLTHGKSSKHMTAASSFNNSSHKFEFPSFQFQDDPLSKPSIAISSVYSTTNPLRNSSPIPAPKVENSSSYYELEKIKAEALAAKYKAEAGYFNELADLTRSKRVYVELQCQELRKLLDQ